MSNQSFPLPPDSSLDSWQRILKQEILWMQGNRTPYDWGNHHGSIRSNYHKGPGEEESKGILYKAPASFCCGATGELFLRTWKRWMEGYEDDDFHSDAIYELIRHYFFRRMDLGEKYLKGAKAGLEWISEQSEWLEIASSEEPSEMPFGAFIQFDFDHGSGKAGHSAVVVGHGSVKNRPVLYVWSSNKNYSDDSPYTKGQPDGHGWDFFYKDPESRRFYGAWVVP